MLARLCRLRASRLLRLPPRGSASAETALGREGHIIQRFVLLFYHEDNALILSFIDEQTLHLRSAMRSRRRTPNCQGPMLRCGLLPQLPQRMSVEAFVRHQLVVAGFKRPTCLWSHAFQQEELCLLFLPLSGVLEPPLELSSQRHFRYDALSHMGHKKTLKPYNCASFRLLRYEPATMAPPFRKCSLARELRQHCGALHSELSLGATSSTLVSSSCGLA